MSKNIAKRFICGVLALASMSACVVTSTACETNYPEVQLTLSFNGAEYALDYKLNRQAAPRTVAHFLWLADNGYYNNLCVHNYDESAEIMYTGAYSCSEEGDLVYKEYYNVIKEYENFGDFPVSVWMEKNKDNPLYTLAGEFSENKFTVESGKYRQTFGSLTMYYTSKNTTEEVAIEYLGERKGEFAYRDYQYNSATSQFYISLSNSSTSNSDYCTFAALEEASEETLENFVEALEAYIEENFGDEDESDDTFTTKTSVTIDADDQFVSGKKTATYNVPSKSIVIKEVKVKKY